MKGWGVLAQTLANPRHFFIEMPVPIEEMLVMYICVSAWFLLDFGPVPLV
jgi:hypothetical protein